MDLFHTHIECLFSTMSLSALVPENTNKTKATAVNTFKRFLGCEDISLDMLYARLTSDSSGEVLHRVLEKFAYYLTSLKTKEATMIKRNTVMSYFRHAKLWLIDMFNPPSAVQDKIMKMGSKLEKYCAKRPQGMEVKQAHSTNKATLRRLLDHMYTMALNVHDYQDIAAIALLWYIFGRSSDLAFLTKGSVALDQGGFLTVRLMRVKTGSQQGLSLFPDDDAVSCPIVALAVAIASQTTPSEALLT